MEALLIIGCFLLAAHASLEEDWNYKRDDLDKGPSAWPRRFSDFCNGSRNSPVDLDTYIETDLQSWTFSDTWETNQRYVAENKGHTAEFSPLNSLMVAGEALPTIYTMAAFHFHWSQETANGSEHLINGSRFALEMHIVHYKSGFSSVADALSSNQSGALAVLGFLFEIDNNINNTALDSMLKVLSNLTDYNSSVTVNLMPLKSIIGSSLYRNYFRYNGSLTTPHCNEQVLWTIFQSPILISPFQVGLFQRLNTSSAGTELYRPPSPLGKRTILLYTNAHSSVTTDPTTSGQVVTMTRHSVFIAVISLLVILSL